MPEDKNISVNVKGKECYKHIISLNEYVKSEILIPKELDTTEFKAITQLANQFFKLGVTEQLNNDEEFNTNSGRYIWTNINEQKLVELVKTGKYSLEMLSKEFNVDISRITSKLIRMKLKLGDYLYNGHGNNIAGDINHPPIDTVMFSGYGDNEVINFVKWWDTLNYAQQREYCKRHKVERLVVFNRLKWYRKKLHIKNR